MTALSLLFGPILFGWAKPTPVNPSNFRDRRNGEVLVAMAGPFSNLVMAILGAFVVRLGTQLDVWESAPLEVRAGLYYFVAFNVLLAIFNLIPVPPLDGSALLYRFLTPAQAWQVRPLLAQYGIFILVSACSCWPAATSPTSSSMSRTSWWAAKVRQLRTPPRRAREPRGARTSWPPGSARRAGAVRRAARRRPPPRPRRRCRPAARPAFATGTCSPPRSSTTARRATPGRCRGSRGRSARRSGRGCGRSRAARAGLGRALTRLATTPRRSARLVAVGRAAAVRRRPRPVPGRAAGPEYGPAFKAADEAC